MTTMGNRQFETTDPLPAGDSVAFAKVVTLPATTSIYKIIAVANPGNKINELVYTNNNSTVPFKILPA
ncbi:MAG: hypothetical protein U0Z17_01525 [Bacteroidales bacterium]